MSVAGRVHVELRPYSAEDLGLLERLLGDPAMMLHLGGPESHDALLARHERYLAMAPEDGELFTILAAGRPVGWVGFWASEWCEATVWECGWHVVTECQRRGIATAAVALALDSARARGAYRDIHAFPSVDNIASNALCRALGFTLLGEVDVEYPIGQVMHSNDWRLDGAAPESG